MRASKENAENAIQALRKFETKINRTIRGHGDEAANNAAISRFRNELLNFLKAAKAKLPSEAAYEADKTRRRKKAG